MRYAAYSASRASEVEGLGNVPAHWTSMILRRLTDDHRQGYYTTSSYVDDGVKLLRITDLRTNGEIDFSACPRVSRADSTLRSFLLRDGDFVFARTGGAGTYGVVKNLIEEVVFASYLIRFRFNPSSAEPAFLKHYLHSRSFLWAVTRSIHGGVNQNIHAEDIKNAPVALPPLDEQTQIAKFLDYETARIDALIEKQQHLIALLLEKRQAVITRAATKGVVDGVNLRASGIGWMGKVPAHWRILPVKRLFEVSYGLMGEIDRTVDSGTRIISLPNVLKNGTLDLAETSFRILSAKERSAALLRKGDLLFNWRNGSIDHVGKTALFDREGEFAHVSFLLKLRALSDDVVPEFYWLALNGLRASGFFGSSKLQVNVTYNQTELQQVPLPVPPVDEQRRFVAVVVKKYEAIDAACDKVEQSLSVLQERRTALVSAAVTGKINVRNWTPPSTDVLADVT